MRKILFIAVCIAFVLMIAGSAIGLFAYQATQDAPEFYLQAMEVDPAKQVAAGYELQRRLIDMRSDAQRRQKWVATFSDEQINGWLAVELPKQFPDTLPSQASEPRVAIGRDLTQIACRYDGPKLSTVVSLSVQVHLTDEPNVIAVRVQDVRAGALPIPPAQWLDRVSRAADRAGVELRWSSIDGDPVALVTVELWRGAVSNRRYQIDHIDLRDGAIELVGRTTQSDGSPWPEYVQTASYGASKQAVQR